MIFRLLSAIGAIAHFGDAVLNRFRAARGIRRQAAPVLAVIGLATCAVFGVMGYQADNHNTHIYDNVDQLLHDSNARPGELVVVSGRISSKYAYFFSSSGEIAYYDYFLMNEAGTDAIIVRSKTSPQEIWSSYFDYYDSGSYSAEPIEFRGTLGEPTSIATSVSVAKVGTLKVLKGFIIKDGDTPPPAGLLFTISILAGVFGLCCLIGWRSGYVAFRQGRAGPSTQSMADRWAIARVTGRLSTAGSTRRAREMPANLTASATVAGPVALQMTGLFARPRFYSNVPGGVGLPGAGGGPALEVAERPVHLVWTDGATTSMRLTPSLLTEAIPGVAYPFHGARAAIMLRASKGTKLLLSFDDPAVRDSVYHQMRTSGKLVETGDGRLIPFITAAERVAQPVAETAAGPGAELAADPAIVQATAPAAESMSEPASEPVFEPAFSPAAAASAEPGPEPSSTAG